ncbi:MAG TPA: STAS domain-containing protein [Oscillatoriaceae cyanobacterium]
MFDYTLHATSGGLVLALSGDLDTHAAQAFDNAMEAHIGRIATDLTIDLAQLTYLNSTGIRSFIRLHKLLKTNGRNMTFRGASAKILRIFHYCGLDAFFAFEPEAEPGVLLAVQEG